MALPAQIADDRALQFLSSRIDYERTCPVPYDQRDFRLDRMRDLLARLGNPQDGLRIVHVAGTKGKGSTAAMVSSMLAAAGYKTGLYTSPHLERVEERLMVDGAICPTDEFAELVARVQSVVAEMDAAGQPSGIAGPTYFEIVTALALLRFALERVDAAVLEVGLGGRLDSTNVCQPAVSVITSISLDHTELLGSTLGAIAAEKAGIIKPGVPVVSGVSADEPREVIARVAADRGCRLWQLGRDFSFNYRPPRHLERAASPATMDYAAATETGPLERNDLHVALAGRHQSANAALAIAALGQLKRVGLDVPESALRRGLAEVRWPARAEVLRRDPVVVLDAAHNVASAEALASLLTESFAAGRRLLVFATTRDKDVEGILRVLLPRFDEVIFTRYALNPRGVAPEELDALAGSFSPIPRHVCAEPGAAWQRAQSLASADDLICIAGSIFIAAEMRSLIGRAE